MKTIKVGRENATFYVMEDTRRNYGVRVRLPLWKWWVLLLCFRLEHTTQKWLKRAYISGVED